MYVCVIPARGGSKRIPRKNIKDFSGKPMIAWSIEAALSSRLFAHVFVSTDDPEIAEISKAYGAEVPFVRPGDLSDDHTGTTPVIAHATQWVKCNVGTPDAVCSVYPTSPFLTGGDLSRGLSMLRGNPMADFVISVANYAFPIQRAVRLVDNKWIEMYQPEHFTTRSQDLETSYHDAGQFYWGTTKAWLEQKTILASHTLACIMPRHRVQDIDTPEDWEFAQYLFRVASEMQRA
jgi:pseudaminic acid cytidylyltransferase